MDPYKFSLMVHTAISVGSSGKNGTVNFLNHRGYPEPYPVTIVYEIWGAVYAT